MEDIADSPATDGQDLVDDWEDRLDAIVLSQGANSVTIPGPNNSTNQVSDPTEKYFWTPNAATVLAVEQFIFTDLDTSADMSVEMRTAGSGTVVPSALSGRISTGEPTVRGDLSVVAPVDPVDPTTGNSVTLTLPAGQTSGDIFIRFQQQESGLGDVSSLSSDTGNRYLTRLQLFGTDTVDIEVRCAETLPDSINTGGQDLNDNWEEYAEAVTLYAPVAGTITLKGPNHPDIESGESDTTETYSWQAAGSDHSALRAWMIAYVLLTDAQKAEATITLADGASVVEAAELSGRISTGKPTVRGDLSIVAPPAILPSLLSGRISTGEAYCSGRPICCSTSADSSLPQLSGRISTGEAYCSGRPIPLL